MKLVHLTAVGKEHKTVLSVEQGVFVGIPAEEQMMPRCSQELHGHGVAFIFANWNNTSGDVDVLTHECGHAFEGYVALTARELQKKLRAEGKPWELCKGFDGSAAIGDWVPLEMDCKETQ